MVNRKLIRELLSESACTHNDKKRVHVTNQSRERQVVVVLLKGHRSHFFLMLMQFTLFTHRQLVKEPLGRQELHLQVTKVKTIQLQDTTQM